MEKQTLSPQQMPRPKGQGRRPRQYGDPNFKGLGKILCAACGKPTRDHKTGPPCPVLGLRPGERMTVPKRADYPRKDS